MYLFINNFPLVLKIDLTNLLSFPHGNCGCVDITLIVIIEGLERIKYKNSCLEGSDRSQNPFQAHTNS